MGPTTTEELGKKKLLRPLVGRLILVLFTLVIGLLSIEVGLRLFAPVAGDRYGQSANTERYGYGYSPYEIIHVPDPDSDRVFSSRLNQSGWRDVDHTVDNPDNNLRIVVVGDSNTFGYAVSFEGLYTRVLERKLRDLGYRAEVISIGYGGWGTDQALEALINEGFSYKPHLVIVQYCGNDPQDNLSEGFGGTKPFRYRLAEDGALVRTAVKREPKKPRKWKLNWELAKRYRALRDRGPEYRSNGLIFDKNNDLRLQWGCGIPEDDALLQWLRNHRGKELDPEEVREQCRLTGHQELSERVLQLLESRGFYENWSPERYHPVPFKTETPEWELLKALLGRIQELAAEAGAETLLLSDNEIGMYRWATSWAMTEDSPEALENYMSSNKVLKDFCEQVGIGFIPHKHVHQRARNDAHPNEIGNEAMADNILDYLQAEHRELLEQFK